MGSNRAVVALGCVLALAACASDSPSFRGNEPASETAEAGNESAAAADGASAGEPGGTGTAQAGDERNTAAGGGASPGNAMAGGGTGEAEAGSASDADACAGQEASCVAVCEGGACQCECPTVGGGDGDAGEATAGSGADADVCAGQDASCVAVCEGGACQCECPSGPSCVVARQLDSCCPAYRAASAQELQDDECLVPYPGLVDDPPLVTRCLARSPVDCAIVQCGLPQPAPTRAAQPDGMGGCRYGDECSLNEDCVLALDAAACCPCATSMPRAMVESNRCLTTPEARSPPDACKQCSSTQPCLECAVAAPPTCVIRDSFNLCR